MNRLHPLLDFSELIARRTERFSGREWVFDRIGQWLGADTNPFFLLSGEPGTGKSSISARLAQFSLGEVVPPVPGLGTNFLLLGHFCQSTRDSTLDPRDFVRAIAEQLSGVYESYANELLNVGDQTISLEGSVKAERIESGATATGVIVKLQIGDLSARLAFNHLIRGPLKKAVEISPPKHDFVILIDGLDESLTYSSSNTVVHLLRAVLNDLPPQMRFLATSRPDKRVLDVLGHSTLDLLGDVPAGTTDIPNYIRTWLADKSRYSDELVEEISSRQQGNFLYAYHICREISEGRLNPQSKTWSLPSDLNDIYMQFCQRELKTDLSRWQTTYRKLLSVLAVAQEPGLMRQQISNITGLSSSIVIDALTTLSQFLEHPGEEGPFHIYHESFREYLLSEEIDQQDAHAQMAGFYLDEYEGDWERCQDSYALRNTAYHLAESVGSPIRKSDHGTVERLVELVGDREFQQAVVSEKTGDLVLMRRSIERALGLAVGDPHEDSASLVVRGALNAVLFDRRYLQPEGLYELARAEKFDQARLRLNLFPVDPVWRIVIELSLVWESMLSPQNKVGQIAQRATRNGLWGERFVRLTNRILGKSIYKESLPSTPDPAVTKGILAFMSGQDENGAAEALLSNYAEGMPSLLPTDDEAPLYLAEQHAPIFVAASVPEPRENATQELREYIQLHASNRYVYYRNRSLLAILDEVVKHPDDDWVRQMVQALCMAALSPGEEFGHYLPTALRCLDSASGEVSSDWIRNQIPKVLEQADQIIVDRTGDPWSHVLRSIALLAESLVLIEGDKENVRKDAISLLEKSLELKRGYAGFRASAATFLAEAAEIVSRSEPAIVEKALSEALKAAQNIQDPYFCLVTTSRVNGTIRAWMPPEGIDIARVVGTMIDRTRAKAYQALYYVGESFTLRDHGPQKIELPEEFTNASTLREIAHIFQVGLREMLVMNISEDDVKMLLSPRVGEISGVMGEYRLLSAGDQTLPEKQEVGIPDPGMGPSVATRMSVAIINDKALSDKAKSRLLQQLVPAALGARTYLDILLARLVLASARVDESLQKDYQNLISMAEASVEPPGGATYQTFEINPLAFPKT